MPQEKRGGLGWIDWYVSDSMAGVFVYEPDLENGTVFRRRYKGQLVGKHRAIQVKPGWIIADNDGNFQTYIDDNGNGHVVRIGVVNDDYSVRMFTPSEVQLFMDLDLKIAVEQ